MSAMPPIRRRPARLAGAVCVAFVFAVLAGCSDAEVEPPIDVDEMLAESAMVMGEVTGVRFDIALEGARLTIDADGVLGFKRAEGRYEAPASADAVITVDAAGFVTQVGAVIVDGTTWLTNPITGKWEILPGGIGFDPTEIFDPGIGMRPLLADDLSGVTFVATEERDGRTSHHLRGTAAAPRVTVITGGLVRDQDVTLDFWLDANDATVVAAEFSNGTTDGTASWTLSFSEYGAVFDVQPPDVSGDA